MGSPERQGGGNVRPWVFPLVAVLVATLGAVVAAEVGLRVFHHLRGTYRLDEEAVEARQASIWIRSDDPELMFVHRPDYRKEGIRYTEAHGILRSEDVTLEKSQGMLRIVLLGDSIGAGITLPYERRLSTLLERGLASSWAGRPVEVLNFCVNGYKTIQEARLLEAAAAGFDPDLIIVAYCMNDVANSLTPTRWFLDPSPPRLYLWDAIGIALGIDSSRRAPRVPVFGPDYAHGPYKYWHQLYAPGSEGWRSVLEGFNRIAWFASEHSCPVLLVVFPFFLPDDWYAGGVEPLHAQVALAAERNGFVVLDLLPIYAHYEVAEVRDDPADIFHPNARGHEIAAAAIEERLRRILGPP